MSVNTANAEAASIEEAVKKYTLGDNFNPSYQAITSSADFTKYVDHIIESGLEFGFDIESGFVGDPTMDKIAVRTMHPQWILVGFSLSYSTEEDFANDTTAARYIPVAHDEGPNIDNPVQVARDLWRLLQTGRGIAHNGSFELKGTGRWFRETLGDDPKYGPAVTKDFGIFPLKEDSLLLAFTADLWQGAKHKYKNTNVGNDLKNVVHHVFGHKMTEFKDLFEHLKLKKQAHARFNMLPVGKREIDYACEDALWCLQLARRARKEAKEDPQYNETAYKIEMLLLPVVARMDQRGIPLDWNYMEQKLEEAEELRQKMNDEILQEISDHLGDEVTNTNLGSPKQVAELLYDKLQIPQPRERGEETRSTAEKPLQSIAKSNKFVRDILTYRTVVKLIGSYLKKYTTTLNYGDGKSEYAAVPGKAYPSHNATGAISGRFSVDGMSYQQLPKPYFYKLNSGQEYHLAFREVIKAPEGFRIVGFDYSQIQLRMMAGFAQEKNMLNAFARGIDIHTATASSMLGVPVDEVTDKQRSIGKALANSEPVLTPSGWIPIGDVKLGDEVVVPSGGTGEVVGVYPQGVRPIYDVTFEDGTVVRADAQHRWPVKDVSHHVARTLTTEEISQAGLRMKAGKGKSTWKWYVENVAPLEFDGVSALPVDPYLLGILLGDGGLSSPAVVLAVGDQDKEETRNNVLAAIEGTGVQLRDTASGFVLTSSVPGAYRNSVDRELKALGLRGSKAQFDGRFGYRSWEKFVPQEYLFAGVDQRYEILRGIMDADGTVGADGRALLTTTSKQLAEDTMFLARSLGGRSKITRTRNTSYTYKDDKKQGRLSYEVLVSTPEVPFKLKRKADKWIAICESKGHRMHHKKITSIELSGMEPATCITVDTPEHEFITSGVTRTKNTLNFSIVFGQGPDALANALTTPEHPVTIDDAVKLLKQYYAGFPALRDWMAGLQATARKKEFVRGLYGRRYKIWEHYSPLRGVQSKGDRTAVNEPIQGAEAIYAKYAMIRADHAIRKAGLQDKIQLVIMVHDALEFYVHESVSTQEVIDLLGDAVSYPIESVDSRYTGFPEIKSDWHEGPNLGALVEIELDDNKKIVEYSMKMEVTGADTVKWKGGTFDEVFNQYKEWRTTQHPEVLNKAKLRDGTLAEIKAQVPEETKETPKTFEIRLTQNLTAQAASDLKSMLTGNPGPHSYKIVMPAGTAALTGITSSVDLSSQKVVSFILMDIGGATMNEIKEL